VSASSNLDLVRSIYAAWERGDSGSADWADLNIEYVHADGPSPGSSTGLAAMRDGFRDWADAWEEYRVTAEEFCELDEERVLVLNDSAGRGKASGLELAGMQAKGATLFLLRGDKIASIVAYWDRQNAFADLGLAPEGGSP
jgi:ketosteroid isomerase-like protein